MKGIFVLFSFLFSAAFAQAGQGSVALTINGIGTAQSNAPVFTGMPFRPGELTDSTQVDLLIQGVSVPVQTQVLSTYPNGSIRVLLLGFRATVGAGQTINAEVRYGQGVGIALSPAMSWTRNLNVLALFPSRWYGESTVFNQRFLASADNTVFPAFETEMTSNYSTTSDPPSTTSSTTRPYYDHMHAVYMTMLRKGGPDSTLKRAWDEVNQYRENEVLHSGTYKGQFVGSLASSSNTWPMQIAIVRRQYVVGMLDDYYITGDPRSLVVAQELADALQYDSTLRSTDYTYTERIPGWTIMGLVAMYQQTQDSKYLTGANKVANIELNHQSAMATKYTNQAGVGGLTGGFLQDRNGVWFDPDESTCSGCGSPFMSSLLVEGLIRLYWVTGDTRLRDSVVKAAEWLRVGCYDPLDASYWYVCKDTSTGTTPSLNPMFLEALGFAYQVTGNTAYRNQALSILAVNDWGNHIKEFNQGQHSSGAGLYLLQSAAGSVPLTLSASGGTGPVVTPAPSPVPTASPTPLKTMTVKTSMDGFTMSSEPSARHAGLTSFRVRTSPTTEAYFKFSVSGLTGYQIVSASLRVHTGSNGTVNGPTLYRTSTSWSESTLTWNTRPANSSGVLGDLGSMGLRTWYSYPITGQITENGTYSFKVVGVSTDDVFIDAMEDGLVNAAELVIQYR